MKLSPGVNLGMTNTFADLPGGGLARTPIAVFDGALWLRDASGVLLASVDLATGIERARFSDVGRSFVDRVHHQQGAIVILERREYSIGSLVAYDLEKRGPSWERESTAFGYQGVLGTTDRGLVVGQMTDGGQQWTGVELDFGTGRELSRCTVPVAGAG